MSDEARAILLIKYIHELLHAKGRVFENRLEFLQWIDEDIDLAEKITNLAAGRVKPQKKN